MLIIGTRSLKGSKSPYDNFTRLRAIGSSAWHRQHVSVLVVDGARRFLLVLRGLFRLSLQKPSRDAPPRFV